MTRRASRILALDPAKACGYAWTTDDEVHTEQAGTWHLDIGSKPRCDSPLYRLGNLVSLLNIEHPKQVYWEAPGGYQGVAANAWAYMLDRQIESWCLERGIINRATLRPNQLKHHATGGGVASKADMLKAAEAKWGPLPAELDDNAVDALWVLDWALTPQGEV